MRAFRRKYRNRAGALVESGRWHVEFTGPDDVRRRLPAFTDKKASMELGRKLEALAAAAAAGAAPDRALQQWLSELPPRLLERLREWGLVEPERVAAGKRLSEHVADYGRALRDRGGSDGHARQQTGRVLRVLRALKARRWQDVKPGRVQAWLADRVRAGDFGLKTANHYRTALYAFGQWLVQEARAHDNPIARVERRKSSKDVRRRRRALTADERRRLVAAAEASADVVGGLDGPARALTYRLALTCGLRWGELGKLTAAAFDLDARPPTVTLEGAYTKNGQSATLPLRPEVAALVAPRLAGKAPGDLLFPGRWQKRGAEMLRHDLAAAGIPYRDGRGRVVDFHALRHTFGKSLQEAGVHPKVAQNLMRHSSIVLTMDVYTGPAALETQGEAVAALAALDSPAAPPESAAEPLREATPLRATGTDGEAPEVLTAQLTYLRAKTCDSTHSHATLLGGVGNARKSPHGAAEGHERALQHGEADETRTRNLRIDSPML